MKILSNGGISYEDEIDDLAVLFDLFWLDWDNARILNWLDSVGVKDRYCLTPKQRDALIGILKRKLHSFAPEEFIEFHRLWFETEHLMAQLTLTRRDPMIRKWMEREGVAYDGINLKALRQLRDALRAAVGEEVAA